MAKKSEPNNSGKNGAAAKRSATEASSTTDATATPTSIKNSPAFKFIAGVVQGVAWIGILVYAAIMAMDIRMYAIKTYGPVIHEFDPWFNYRATQYLSDHGWHEFFHWFDYKVWYPLGRPVGTTIYPGMQITSVAIHRILQYFGVKMDIPVMVTPGDDPVTDHRQPTLSDVCAYVPVWFGASATITLGLLVYECTFSWASSAAAALIMAVIPAHIMRSVGGGYDNESVAITAMCLTFFLWTRALRLPTAKTGKEEAAAVRDGTATYGSIVFGILTGFAYINMAAAWGGFIFVLNLIAAHTALLCILGRFSSRLHRAYTMFFIIGTLGAMRVPVIGLGPLRSMEQLSGLVVFVFVQVLEYCEYLRRKQKYTLFRTFLNRIGFGILTLIVLAGLAFLLLPTGYFGPLGARIRGLFVKHTRTGNPLVDSVAEHQPASERAYQTYLQQCYFLAQVGFVISFLRLTDSNTFLITYAAVAYFFSTKMSRLIILLGPVASALGGVAVGFAVDHGVLNLLPGRNRVFNPVGSGSQCDKPVREASEGVEGDNVAKVLGIIAQGVGYTTGKVTKWFNNPSLAPVKIVALCYVVYFYGIPEWKKFYAYCHQFAEQSSSPQIMFKAQLRSGQTVIVDDYREGYFWLRDNTPEDARVLSWWDYGTWEF